MSQAVVKDTQPEVNDILGLLLLVRGLERLAIRSIKRQGGCWRDGYRLWLKGVWGIGWHCLGEGSLVCDGDEDEFEGNDGEVEENEVHLGRLMPYSGAEKAHVKW